MEYLKQPLRGVIAYLVLALLAAALTGCGSPDEMDDNTGGTGSTTGSGGSTTGGTGGSSVSTLSLQFEDASGNPATEFVAINGVPTAIRVSVIDPNLPGKHFALKDASWEHQPAITMNPSTLMSAAIDMVNSTVVVTPLVDTLDLGTEPVITLGIMLGAASANATITSVLNASGTHEVDVTLASGVFLTTYLIVEQNGRTLSGRNCDGTLNTCDHGYAGAVTDTGFTFQMEGRATFTGTFATDSTISGTYTRGASTGTFTAQKL